eukprot:m.205201 g.205201  ORF g.205201 m.205201 type:complete len:445 (-) comp22856_c0_seq1:84-1418(-)
MPSRDSIIGAINNLSIQINFSAATVAVQIMTEGGYVEPKWAKIALLGTVFAGAVCGMVLIGAIGDAISRRAGMLLTLGLTAIGSIGAALGPWGEIETLWGILCGFRFILGMGVGGMYPLSAAKVAETGSDVDATRIAWSFLFQVPGGMIPYIIGWILTASCFDSTSTSVKFRLVLGLGCIPAILVFLNELFTPPPPESKAHAAAIKAAGGGTASLWRTIRSHPDYLWQLIGTGGSWFLYDVTCYGTSVFQPQILESIFNTTKLSYWQNLVVALFGLPGVIVSILLLKSLGSRKLNIYGFWLIAAAFAGLAVCFHVSEEGLKWPKFALFCVVSFAISCGPNVATYVLPATLFPFEVRTTFHGLSAGSGKLGAVVGTFMYDPIEESAGIAAVLWTQVIVSIAAAFLATWFIDKEHFDVDDPTLISNVDDDETTPLKPNGSVNTDYV